MQGLFFLIIIIISAENHFSLQIMISSLSSMAYAVNLQNDFLHLSFILFFSIEASSIRCHTFFTTHFAFSCG